MYVKLNDDYVENCDDVVYVVVPTSSVCLTVGGLFCFSVVVAFCLVCC